MINTSEFTMTCENGDFKVEASGLIPTETLEAMENLGSDVEVEMEQHTVNYPTTKNTSLNLEDGNVNIKAKAFGLQVLNLTISVLEREIEGLKTIETKAGTFECVKINETLQIADKRKEKNHPTEVWYLPGFGPIKSVLYKPNGILMEYSVVTSITKK